MSPLWCPLSRRRIAQGFTVEDGLERHTGEFYFKDINSWTEKCHQCTEHCGDLAEK